MIFVVQVVAKRAKLPVGRDYFRAMPVHVRFVQSVISQVPSARLMWHPVDWFNGSNFLGGHQGGS